MNFVEVYHVCHEYEIELVNLPAQMLSLIAEILRRRAIVLPILHLQKKVCIVFNKIYAKIINYRYKK